MEKKKIVKVIYLQPLWRKKDEETLGFLGLLPYPDNAFLFQTYHWTNRNVGSSCVVSPTKVTLDKELAQEGSIVQQQQLALR